MTHQQPRTVSFITDTSINNIDTRINTKGTNVSAWSCRNSLPKALCNGRIYVAVYTPFCNNTVCVTLHVYTTLQWGSVCYTVHTSCNGTVCVTL